MEVPKEMAEVVALAKRSTDLDRPLLEMDREQNKNRKI